MVAIELVEKAQAFGFALLGDNAVVRRKEVEDWVCGAWPDHGSLVGSRKKTSAPIGRAVWGKAARIRQDHEGRQVFRQAPQAVTDPAPHARKTGEHKAGALHKRRRPVDIRLGHHGVNEGDVVHTAGQVGQEAADVLATLPARLPGPRALHVRSRRTLKELNLAAGIKLLSVALDQLRLVVEGVNLAGGAGHEQLDYALGLGPVV